MTNVGRAGTRPADRLGLTDARPRRRWREPHRLPRVTLWTFVVARSDRRISRCSPRSARTLGTARPGHGSAPPGDEVRTAIRDSARPQRPLIGTSADSGMSALVLNDVE